MTSGATTLGEYIAGCPPPVRGELIERIVKLRVRKNLVEAAKRRRNG